MMTNFKTTIPGVLMLLGVLWNAYSTKTVNIGDVMAALGAIGLINAKDWNVTGGDKQQ